MPSIDFTKVKEIVPLAEVMKLLNVFINEKKSSAGRAACPFGCHTDPRCMSFDTETNLWICHRCHKAGSQIDLYALVKNMDVFNAACQICVLTGKKIPWMPRSLERRERAPRKPRNSVSEQEEDVL